jgi:hypothetical protein
VFIPCALCKKKRKEKKRKKERKGKKRKEKKKERKRKRKEKKKEKEKKKKSKEKERKDKRKEKEKVACTKSTLLSLLPLLRRENAIPERVVPLTFCRGCSRMHDLNNGIAGTLGA